MIENPSAIDIGEIMKMLPHRYPFLLVDKVHSINGTASAIGIKNVTMNEPHFQGHFPGNPIMPGVTIIEAMAQTAAVMVGTSMGLVNNDLLVYFMAIDGCKFRRKDRKKRFRGWALACHIRHADRLKTCVRNIARRMAKVDTNPDG